MALRLVSYNILADSYVRRSWYPRCTDEALDPVRRRAALCEHVAQLGAAVLCMQEVEGRALEALADRLSPAGYRHLYLPKGESKPDGCATFYRTDRVELVGQNRHHYGDGSGHVALIANLIFEGRELAVANTHVRWSPPTTPLSESFGHRQLGELASSIAGDAWVVCGDFNMKPEAPALDLLRDRGLFDVYESAPAHTCNPNGEAKRIDFVFAGRALVADPLPVPAIDDRTPLPSDSEPSDHLAIGADLRWR